MEGSPPTTHGDTMDLPEPTDDVQAGLDALAAANDAALELLGDTSAGTSIVPTGGDAAVVKATMASRRAEIVKAQQAVVAAQEQAKAIIAAEKAALDARLREMELAIAPMREQIELLEEGIWTMNLYVGRDESFSQIADGEPAPAGTPITVRQMTLYMDEECRVAAEDGGIDAKAIAAFDQWIISDPAHLEQVFPEPKGIVAFQPRRTNKDYGDMATNLSMGAKNAHTWWLIRNGERLWWMSTDFELGERMIPAPDEFTSYFERTVGHGADRHTETLRPGTPEWDRADKSAGKHKRHFMRVALILQGLVDRTPVLHPLPDGLSFLTHESYDAGHINVITDAVGALGSGIEPFEEWRSALAAEMKVGMRVIGAFDTTEGRRELSPDRDRYGSYGGRLHPTEASYPEANVLHTLESRVADGGLKFLYERTDKRWGYEHGDHGRWGQWPFKQRASCTIFPTDSFVLPFDLVTVTEMQRYLDARTERHHYAQMVPLLKAAIAAKNAEAAEEAPMRTLLAGEIAKATDGDVAAAEAAVGELVTWWKLKNRWHRPLVGVDTKTQAKAIRMIVAEHKARLTAAGTDKAAEAKVLAALRSAHPDAMVIARRRDGRYITLTAEERAPFVAVATTTPTGRSTKVERWAAVPSGRGSWRILFSTKVWDTWNHAKTIGEVLTPDEEAGVIDEIRSRFPGIYTVTDQLGKHEGSWALHQIVSHPTRTVDDRARTDYAAIFVKSPLEDPDYSLLLTNPPAAPTSYSIDFSWRRSRNQVVLEAQRTTPSSHIPSQTVQVWLDEDLDARIAEVTAAVAVAKGRREVLRSKVDTLESSIAAQWAHRAAAEVYARFLDDFMDASLWEGHLKTIGSLPRYPHHHMTTHDEPALTIVLNGLVERGIDPTGLTVTAAGELYATSVAPLDAERTDRSGFRRGAITIPDDIAELVLGAEPEGPTPWILDEDDRW